MKRQLSNNQTAFVQVMLVLTGLGLPCFILTFFIFSSDNFNITGRVIIAAFSIIFGLSVLYFSAHLYKISFDRDFIYVSRLGKIKKISIEKIEEIKPGFGSFRLFYSNIYVVTITYFDNQKRNKVQFLSKGATGLTGTIDHIPLLDILKQFIKDRKYN